MDNTNKRTETNGNSLNNELNEIVDIKNGIVDGYYYENGVPVHKGAVKIGEDTYYIGSGGKVATGYHVVHSSMSNGILKHGTYKFADDGKMIDGSYIKPKKIKKDKKKSAFSKRTKVTAIILACFTVFSLSAFLYHYLKPNKPEPDEEIIANDQEDTSRSGILLPEYKEPVYLCNDTVADYYKGLISIDEALRLNKGSGAYKGFAFEYEIPDGSEQGEGGNITKAVLEVSDDENFLNASHYDLDPQKTEVSIDNLIPGMKYYYRVTARQQIQNEDTGDVTYEDSIYKGEFTTAETDRFIYIANLDNTRDIGGYKTADGKTVKYGMLIRGTELDGLVENSYFLTDRETAESFNFACDLDLRDTVLFNGNYQSMLGKNVSHKFYSAPMYGSIFSESYQPALKEIFHDLANPDNYPMYLHCTYGVDRTGTIAFLLQGILGVSENDMNNQYVLSGFYSSSVTSAGVNSIYGGLEGTEGNTINEKIVNYLVDVVGVSMEDIESIRAILLEE